jgi:hypothetical protein
MLTLRSIQFCRSNHAMLLVQLGVNSTRDVWKFVKLDSPRPLVPFWQNFETSLVLLIPNCTRHRMITNTKKRKPIWTSDLFFTIQGHQGRCYPPWPALRSFSTSPVSYRNVPVSMRSLKMSFPIYVLPVDLRIKIKSSSQVNVIAYYRSITNQLSLNFEI